MSIFIRRENILVVHFSNLASQTLEFTLSYTPESFPQKVFHNILWFFLLTSQNISDNMADISAVETFNSVSQLKSKEHFRVTN